LLSCCQQPNNPATQQPNNPTTQQPSNPTTQQPKNPTTQQPNNPTAQQPNNTTTQQPTTQLIWPGGMREAIKSAAPAGVLDAFGLIHCIDTLHTILHAS